MSRSLFRRGFSLIELLVVVGIIAVLLGMLMPALSRARHQAVIVQCASNLRQIATAFSAYLIPARNTVFWRGADVSLDGMEWYVYGGRESGNINTRQGNLFNKTIPRPLNRYVNNALEIFHCPADAGPTAYSEGGSHFEWVGNSYNFNATGYPIGAYSDRNGLAGVKVTQVRDSSSTILFFDGGMAHHFAWHGRNKGNFCFVDGHVEFIELPPRTGSPFKWHHPDAVAGG